jgi:single-strand DNA-binding protein
MQKLFILGNITKDPERRVTPSGKPVTNFTVAVNDRKDDTATFFRCAAWDKAADTIAEYASKGTKIAIWGFVSTRAYIDKATGQPRASLEVNVHQFEFCGGKRGDANDKIDIGHGIQATVVDNDEVPF